MSNLLDTMPGPMVEALGLGVTHATAAKPAQDWFFTFGSDHAHPYGFVRIHGTYTEAREKMMDRFGTRWSFQYSSPEDFQARKWGMKEVA